MIAVILLSLLAMPLMTECNVIPFKAANYLNRHTDGVGLTFRCAVSYESQMHRETEK